MRSPSCRAKLGPTTHTHLRPFRDELQHWRRKVERELTVTLIRSLAMHGAHRRDQGHGEQDHGPCSRRGFHAHRFTRFSPPALAPCHANAQVTTQPWSPHTFEISFTIRHNRRDHQKQAAPFTKEQIPPKQTSQPDQNSNAGCELASQHPPTSGPETRPDSRLLPVPLPSKQEQGEQI